MHFLVNLVLITSLATLVESKTDYVYITPDLLSPERITEGFPDHIQVSFEYNNEKYIAELHKKHNLFGYNNERNCLYSGILKSYENSTARFTLCYGFHGIIDFQNTSFYIYPLQSTHEKTLQKTIERSHKLIFQSGSTVSQSVNDMIYANSSVALSQPKLRRKRHAATLTKSMYFLELFLVNDHSVYEFYKGDTKLIEERCKIIADIIDDRYKPLNIRVILVGVEIWVENDMIEIEGDAFVTVMEFMRYRETNINNKVRNDDAQLITRFPLEDGRVAGKAPIGVICTEESSAGIAYDESENPTTVANILSHEIGHNLGLTHDTSRCYCNENARGKCIMNEHVDSSITRFSFCSHELMEEFFSHGHGRCLYDFPSTDKRKAVCGNGIVEGNEQCDCGHPENCRKLGNCCDPFKCTLYKNATCASGSCCHKCQFKKRSTLCREKRGDCDLEEYCSGHSGECPSDVYKQDTSFCDNNLGYCVKGLCMSHNHQCRDWLGHAATSADAYCFKEINMKGNKNGHCGQKKNGDFIKCDATNAYCGKVHCTLEQDEFSKDVIENELFWESIQVTLPCLSSHIDDQIANGNLSLAKDGTRCGRDKVCYDNQCIDTKTYRDKIDFTPCLDNCSHNGVCNNLNHCHCFDGWAPPLCNQYGHGGSIDSGPITFLDVMERKNNHEGIYIIVTLVMVTIMLSVFALAWRFGCKIIKKLKDRSNKKESKVQEEDLKELLLEK